MTKVISGFSIIDLLGITNELEKLALLRMRMSKDILITSDNEMWSMECFDDAIGHELDILDSEQNEVKCNAY